MGEPSHRSVRGPALIARHLRSFDPDAPTARERLYAELGCELGRRLVRALARGSSCA